MHIYACDHLRVDAGYVQIGHMQPGAGHGIRGGGVTTDLNPQAKQMVPQRGRLSRNRGHIDRNTW